MSILQKRPSLIISSDSPSFKKDLNFPVAFTTAARLLFFSAAGLLFFSTAGRFPPTPRASTPSSSSAPGGSQLRRASPASQPPPHASGASHLLPPPRLHRAALPDPSSFPPPWHAVAAPHAHPCLDLDLVSGRPLDHEIKHDAARSSSATGRMMQLGMNPSASYTERMQDGRGRSIYAEEMMTPAESFSELAYNPSGRYTASSQQLFQAAKMSLEEMAKIEEEQRYIEREMEKGVVYIMGENEVVARPHSSLLKKFIVNYVYAFLRKNCRQGHKVLSIPRSHLLKVGMSYEI